MNDNLKEKTPKVEILSNRPSPSTLLSPSNLNEGILQKIKEKPNLGKYFKNSFQKWADLSADIEKENSDPCKANSKGRPLLKTFVCELKKAPKKAQNQVFEILGRKKIVAISKKWINLESNEMTPFKYKNLMAEKAPESNKQIVRGAVPQRKSLPTEKIEKKGPEAPIDNSEKYAHLIKKEKHIFKNHQGPGDIVMLTAAVRDLMACYPDKYIIDVDTTSMSIWEGNPNVQFGKQFYDKDIERLNPDDPDVTVHQFGYDLIQQSNQGPYHFTEAFTEEIERALGVSIKNRLGKGDIHIRPQEDIYAWTERTTWFKEYGLDPNAPFWVIDAGHKLDFTAKFWGSGKFQAVVDHFNGKINFVQIGHEDHIHPKLNGVIDLIGKTDDRKLIRLVWASSGVLTPVSYPMVLAAAIPVKPGTCNGQMERPCVIVAGGREPSGWQAHTNHQFVHTCGALPCCQIGGCWKSRTVPIGDGDEKDSSNLCHNVTVDDYKEVVPYCMHIITPEDIIRRIELYNIFYDDDRKRYSYDPEVNKTAPKDTQVVSLAK